MKKPAAIAVGIILAVLWLYACGEITVTPGPMPPNPSLSGAPGAPASALTVQPQPALKANLTVWGWNIAARSLESALENFNRYYPGVKVKVENMGRQEMYDRLNAGLSAGGTALPDIVVVESDYLEVFIAKFPEGFVNLNEKAARYARLYDPVKWSQAVIKDKLRAMPWDLAPAGVFYRADMFEKAGLTAGQIETWDDLIEAGRRVQAANPAVKLAALDFAGDDTLLRIILNQQGGQYFTREGQINLASKEAVQALTIIKRLKEAGLLLEVQGWNGLLQAARSGQTATHIAGAGWSGALMRDAPELAGKWDVMPLPALGKNDPRTASLGGSNLAVLKTSKNFEAAWAFLEYNLATGPGQLYLFKNWGLWPSFLPVYDDPYFSAAHPYFSNKPVWNVFAAGLKDQKKPVYNGDYDKAIKAAAEAQALVFQGSDPALALKAAAEKLEVLTGREQVKTGQN